MRRDEPVLESVASPMSMAVPMAAVDTAATLAAASRPVTPRGLEVSEPAFIEHAAAHGITFGPVSHPFAPEHACPTHFGRVVSGADVAQLNPAQQQILVDALYRYGLLHVPGQDHLSPEDEVAFATLFDYEVENLLAGHPATAILRIPQHPCINVQGNATISDHHGIEGTRELKFTASQSWHTDGISQLVHPPVIGSFLCMEAPCKGRKGGETRFACAERAFELLTDAERELCLRLKIKYSNSAVPATVPLETETTWPEHPNSVLPRPELAPELTAGNFGDANVGVRNSEAGNQAMAVSVDPLQPLVITHPVTKRRGLQGMPKAALGAVEVLPDGSGLKHWTGPEAREFMGRLFQRAVSAPLIYPHKWVEGDLIVYDQWRLYHVPPPLHEIEGESRLHHRIRLTGTQHPTGEVDALMASCGLTDDDLEAALERAAVDAAEAVTAAASAGAAVAASAASSKL
jgi:alpha-ketoglutarate-dependent taurine dioxygenase